jgi:hypothetical protein
MSVSEGLIRICIFLQSNCTISCRWLCFRRYTRTMKTISNKHMFIVQTGILLVGTLFAWSKLLEQISAFQMRYGTLFRFKDCVIPNPFTTPCLYGSIAFLLALLCSYYVTLTLNSLYEKYLRNFLVFCVVFAGSVFLYELVDFYRLFDIGGVIASCSPGLHPMKTPCFYGLIFFTLACGVSFIIVRKNTKYRE